MRVLIDTCVWSRVLRAEDPDPVLSKLLKDLIADNRVVLIGPILQEILSGIKNKKDFQALEKKFAAFDDLLISKEIYIKAAEYYNICKTHGINGGHIDFLICAVISHYNCALFTVDSDFKLFQKHLPIELLGA
jgi:predicted nucleic acid-binding protein